MRRGSFPNLRPSTTTISLRLPAGLLEALKTLANERDVPYQSLLKVFLAERVEQERRRRASASGPAETARAARSCRRPARTGRGEGG